MKIKLLEEAMAFFLFCLIMLTSPALSTAKEERPIRTLGDIPSEVIESVKEALEKFRPALQVKAPGQNQAVEVLRPLSNPEAPQFDCNPREKAYYFFSFSMPEESISLAIEDALRINKKCETKMILVVRGFIDNNLKATIRKLYSLMKEKPQGDWPVTIDPPLFEKYHIPEVPTLLLEAGDKTGKIKGDLRIGAALEKLHRDPSDQGKYGATYSIKERDIREFIAAKREDLERRIGEKVKDLKSSAYLLSRYEGRFGQAKEDRAYYMDPSVILTEDIRDHEGRVVFPRGVSFNPAAYFPLGRYIILDGNSQKQVEFALKGEFKKMILMGGNISELSRKHKKRFYFANEAIIDRLKIARTPAIIEQEGEYIRVTEKSID